MSQKHRKNDLFGHISQAAVVTRARTINNDIAILNAVHSSTHCAKLAKMRACHGRLIQINKTRKPHPVYWLSETVIGRARLHLLRQ